MTTATMWGGRFTAEADPLFRSFNDSLPFDYRLIKHDVRASVAWAEALAEAGVLTAEEQDTITTALRDVAAAAAMDLDAVRAAGEEDVHSFVEARLVERIGDLGKKLHTGRSRNDQVATDLRLWVREQVAARAEELRSVQEALIELARRESGAVIPGMTHLQPAQPVPFAHWCLAYFEMLDRDAARFEQAHRSAGLCPLGSGALAGTAYPIDRHALARRLGFDGPTRNSLDAVSDRDFALEALHATAVCGLHLSRIAEDLIIFASKPFSIVRLDDSVAGGSSLMPQKKNPDALELIRAKSGRLLGAHTALAVTLKGLPLAYNKDLQEDKEPLFDAMDTLSLCLRVLARVLAGMTIDAEAARAAATDGCTNATDLADYLVQSAGMPFRDAHHAAGKIVLAAIERNVPLEELPMEVFRSFAPQIQNDVYDALALKAVLERRNVPGGAAPSRVAEALVHARERLSQARAGVMNGHSGGSA